MSTMMKVAGRTQGARFAGTLARAIAIVGSAAPAFAQGADPSALQRFVQEEPVQQKEPAQTSAAIENWQHSLIAHIDRFKRYPPQAGDAGGVVTLAFSIDRKGNVVSSRVAKSSGSAALDAAALATIKRASPLPAPPPDVADAALSFGLPIRYAPGGKR